MALEHGRGGTGVTRDKQRELKAQEEEEGGAEEHLPPRSCTERTGRLRTEALTAPQELPGSVSWRGGAWGYCLSSGFGDTRHSQLGHRLITRTGEKLEGPHAPETAGPRQKVSHSSFPVRKRLSTTLSPQTLITPSSLCPIGSCCLHSVWHWGPVRPG